MKTATQNRAWSIGNRIVIAPTAKRARKIYKENFGPEPNIKCELYEGPWKLTDGDQEFEVDEEAFVRTASTFGGGVVHDMS